MLILFSLTAGTNALGDIATTIPTVLGWLGDILDALIGSDGALGAIWPFVIVGFIVSIIMLAIKVMRSFSWGI